MESKSLLFLWSDVERWTQGVIDDLMTLAGSNIQEQ